VRLALLGILLALAAAVVALVLPSRASLGGGIALALFLAMLLRGMVSVRSSLLETTTWRSVDPAEARVALSFDDGPDPEGTPRVLEALREHGVRATFFLLGSRVRQCPLLVRRIVEEGHEVGCHADSHSWLTPMFGPARMRREIEDGLAAIREAAGVTPRLYRPPFLVRSPAHAGVARDLGLVLIGMARRGRDQGEGVDPAALARRVVERTRAGEVIALHDGGVPGRGPGRRPTAEALPAILDGLRGRGLEAVPVSILLGERTYLETEDRGWTGRSRGGRLGQSFFDLLVRAGAVRIASILVVPVAAWFTVFSPQGRRGSVALRRRLLGRASWPVEAWWCFRHFQVFGRTLLGRLEMVRSGGQPPPADYEEFEGVRSVVEGEEGFLFVSAHFGDWALVGRRMAARGRELVVVAARGTGLGPHQVGRDSVRRPFAVIDAEGSPEVLATEVAAALRRGAAVAMLADRMLGSEGIDLPFLGGTARFPTGPWMVAMITGAPVVIVFGLPGPGRRVRVLLRGPIRVPRPAGAGRAEAIASAASRFVAILEEEVRREPFAWSNFHPFWRPE
jgi:peptidoglycan/xylan/chitin deacetylase (PgdA/CDA1 family)/predicted LPLAT superfamily acyltransferase